MNFSKLVENSISLPTSPRFVENDRSDDIVDKILSDENFERGDGNKEEKITSEVIDNNELKLKERIAQCKDIIESLKLQLTEEKAKLKIETTHAAKTSEYVSGCYHNANATVPSYGNSSIYSASVESKLCCDENLIEYEKQLQKYQNTLNLAQNEKKNAIRKQMLAKAFKLKLMEVENQCNIELLRVKQSLQCLEPLQMIANKWKTDPEEDVYNAKNYEFLPNFLELKAQSGSDVNNCRDEPCNLNKSYALADE